MIPKINFSVHKMKLRKRRAKSGGSQGPSRQSSEEETELIRYQSPDIFVIQSQVDTNHSK